MNPLRLLKDLIGSLHGGRSADTQASVNGLTGKLMGPLDAQKGALNKQLSDSIGKALGGQGLDKLFKR